MTRTLNNDDRDASRDIQPTEGTNHTDSNATYHKTDNTGNNEQSDDHDTMGRIADIYTDIHTNKSVHADHNGGNNVKMSIGMELITLIVTMIMVVLTFVLLICAPVPGEQARRRFQ